MNSTLYVAGNTKNFHSLNTSSPPLYSTPYSNHLLTLISLSLSLSVPFKKAAMVEKATTKKEVEYFPAFTR